MEASLSTPEGWVGYLVGPVTGVFRASCGGLFVRSGWRICRCFGEPLSQLVNALVD